MQVSGQYYRRISELRFKVRLYDVRMKWISPFFLDKKGIAIQLPPRHYITAHLLPPTSKQRLTLLNTAWNNIGLTIFAVCLQHGAGTKLYGLKWKAGKNELASYIVQSDHILCCNIEWGMCVDRDWLIEVYVLIMIEWCFVLIMIE